MQLFVFRSIKTPCSSKEHKILLKDKRILKNKLAISRQFIELTEKKRM